MSIRHRSRNGLEKTIARLHNDIGVGGIGENIADDRAGVEIYIGQGRSTMDQIAGDAAPPVTEISFVLFGPTPSKPTSPVTVLPAILSVLLCKPPNAPMARFSMAG